MAEKKRRKKTRSKKSSVKKPEQLIPTGSTGLNNALADNPFGGYRKGTIVNLIGDSSAGKSLLAHTTFAAANQMEEFDDYRFIFDDAECGADFDTEEMFGESTAKRIESPSKKEEGSDTVEDFQMHIGEAIKAGKPFIYILDSFDGLSADADLKKAEEQNKSRKKGNETSGTYGQAKNIVSNQILRQIKAQIKKTNSLLVVVSQVRDNMDTTGNPFAPKRRRAGGKALRHYSWQEIWLMLGSKIQVQVKGKKRQIGIYCNGKVDKNRETGKSRNVPSMPIYYDLGIDDVGSNIDYLVDESFWSKSNGQINAKEFNFKGSRDDLIKYVEENGLETELQLITHECWKDIEDKLRLKSRKKRFE